MKVTVFVPGKPVNPKNVKGMGLHKHRRLIRHARERAQKAMLETSCAFPGRRWPWPADQPKRIRFIAHLPRLVDDDNLAYAISPIRDALGDMGLIGKTPGTWRGPGRVKDGPHDGHVFEYSQVVDKSRHGVEIIVQLAPEGS